jgi:hypothetical protein
LDKGSTHGKSGESQEFQFACWVGVFLLKIPAQKATTHKFFNTHIIFDMTKSFFQIFVVLAIGLLGVSRMNAQATLSVQGTILQGGTLAAIDNGTYDITFKLYTTDAGGTAIWSETQSVNITGGVYSVVLGAVNPLNIPFDQTYFMGLTLPGAPEHTPRTMLTAAPYALSMLGEDNKFPSTGLVQMGSLATGTDITTATSYTVGANDHVIYLDHTANQNAGEQRGGG